MTLLPLGDHILVYPLPEQRLSEIIIVPGNAEQLPPVWGTVVAIGPKVKHTDLKIGHKVLFEMFSGQEKNFKIEGHEVRLIEQEKILAFIEE